MTVVTCPDGVDANRIVRVMDDEFGVRVAGGQAHLSGGVFRIGHMGYVSEEDLLVGIGVLEKALAELGYRFEPGAGLRAAQQALA